MRRLEFTSFIPRPITEVWGFFSSPANLSRITPESMNFRINTQLPEKMYPGMLIGYRVSALRGMRINWLTEITCISEFTYFVDEQRLGPYKIWHHEHHFRQVEGGVEMHDILTYSVPMGWIGKLVDILVVHRKVRSIFSYREKRTAELFPAR